MVKYTYHGLQKTNFIKSFSETQKNNPVPFGIVLYRGEEVVYLDESTLAVPLGLLF